MNYIPYDINLLIYKYLHELNMIDIRNEINHIKNDIKILNYIKDRTFYPYNLWNKITKIKTNNCYAMIIDKYVHKKRMIKTFKEMENKKI